MCKYIISPKIALWESQTTANWADLRTWHVENGAKVRNHPQKRFEGVLSHCKLSGFTYLACGKWCKST